MPSMIDGIGTVSSFKKKATKPAVTAAPSTALSSYEARTGDSGNVVSANSYTQPTTAPVTAPVVSTAPAAAAQPSPTVAPVADVVETGAPAPAQTEQPADSYEDSRLAKFTEQDIAAALAAIEAEFGLTKEELLRDQTMIGAQYRLLTAQMARAQARALESAEAGALQRGLFRSGIFAAETGEIGQQFAEQQAQLSSTTSTQTADLQAQIDTLEAQKAQAKATEETAIRRGEYTARLQAAGL